MKRIEGLIIGFSIPIFVVLFVNKLVEIVLMWNWTEKDLAGFILQYLVSLCGFMLWGFVVSLREKRELKEEVRKDIEEYEKMKDKKQKHITPISDSNDPLYCPSGKVIFTIVDTPYKEEKDE